MKGRDTREPSGFLGVDFLVGLHVALGRIADSLDRLEELEQRRLDALPIYHDFVRANPFPTAGALVVNCGGPAEGRLWHVKRLVVGGISLSVAAAGTAEAYGAGWITDIYGGLTPLTDLMDATILIPAPETPLPNIGNYADGEFVVQAPERVWVVIRNGTPGQVYLVAGTAKDIPVAEADH